MAKEADKLGYKDFFDEALFSPVIDSVNALITALTNLKETIKAGVTPSLNELKAAIAAFNESQKAGAAEVRKVAQAMGQANAVAQAYAKLSDELIRLESKKKALETELAKEVAKARLEVKEAEKGLRLYAKAVTSASRAEEALVFAEKALKKQIDANQESYFHASNALDDLRERYRTLILAGKGASEEASKLRDAIVQLDAALKRADAEVGMFQRNVGNYAKSFKEAMTEFLGASGPAGQAVLALSFALERARDAFIAAGGGAKGFFRAIVEGAKALRGVGIMLLLEGIQKLLSLGEGIEALDAAREKLELVQEEVRLNNELAGIKLKLARVDDGTLRGLAERERLLREQARVELALLEFRRKKAKEELKKAQKAIEDEVEDPINKLLTYIGKGIAELIRAFSILPRAFAQFFRLFGDDNVIADFYDKAAKSINSAADGLERLFSGFAASNIAKQTERIAELTKEVSELDNQTREVQQSLELQLEELQKKREEIAKKAIEAVRVEVESTATAREKLRKEYEKQLADLQARLDEQRRLLEGYPDDLRRVQEEYDLSVAKITAEFERKDAEILAQAIKNIWDVRRQALMGVIEAQIAEVNERFDALRRQLVDSFAELGETDTKLLNELEEARQRAIRKVLLDNAIREQKLREDIAATLLETERANFEKEEDFAKYRERRLAEIQLEGAKERLKLLQELYDTTKDEVQKAEIELQIAQAQAAIAQANAKLREIAQREADAAKKATEDMVKEYIAAVQAITDALDSYLKRIEEKQMDRLGRDRDVLQRRISVYEGLAKQGALAAEQSIAELEAREADLIRRQEALKRQAQRRELALAAIKSYAQLLEKRPETALAQTIRDITILSQVVSKLPTFYEGTEYVREGLRIPNVARDALIVRVHEGERIIPAYINRQLQGVKNEDLPKLVAGGEVSFDYDRFLDTMDVVLSKRNSVKRVKRRL
jgi:hypothetical protein